MRWRLTCAHSWNVRVKHRPKRKDQSWCRIRQHPLQVPWWPFDEVQKTPEGRSSKAALAGISGECAREGRAKCWPSPYPRPISAEKCQASRARAAVDPV